MNLKSFLGVLLLISGVAYADDAETLVYGAAARSNGGENVFIMEQPDNMQNPLGNPIVEPREPVQVFGNLSQPTEIATNNSVQANCSNNQNSPALESKALGQDFQNTLLEANGRVYDVQSFPEQDMKLVNNPAEPQTIYSPNVNAP